MHPSEKKRQTADGLVLAAIDGQLHRLVDVLLAHVFEGLVVFTLFKIRTRNIE